MPTPTPTETWYANADWRSFQRTEYPYQYAEDVVIRYIDLTDPRDLEAKVTYLSALTGITTLKVNGETVVGTWNTHFARYEPVNPNDDRNYVIRLYHALIPAGLTTGDGVYVTENNCTYKTSLTFYWRQAALMNPVTAGTSGVTYRITGINRDRFTGLYDYILEKREQITTYVAEHVVGDTQFDVTYEQKFVGVRKTAEGTDAYTKDNAGNVITALYPMTNVQGTTYTQDITKNENCTADITQRKTVAKTNVELSVQRSRTAFSDTETKVTRNATVAVNAYVAITGGVITVQSSKLNDDGTFDNTETTKTAIPSDAIVTRERTAFSEFVSITLRNQAAAVNAFVNVTGGIITRRTSNKNEDGTYDNTEETRTAIALEAVVTRSQTIFSQVVGITLRNQATAVNAFVAVANGIITTRTSKRNDDGTFDNTEETRTALSTTYSVESSRTLYDDSVTTTIRNAATAVNALVEVAGGVVTIRQSKKNDDGTYDNSETLKTERAVSTAVKRVTKTPFETLTETTNRSQAAAMADPTVNGYTVRNEKTQAGLYDQTEQARVAAGAGAGVVGATATLWENTRHVVTTDTRNKDVKATEPTADTEGVVVNVRNELNDLGKWDASVQNDTAVARRLTVQMLDADGPYTIYLIENYTLAAANAFLATLSGDLKNSVTPHISKYPGLVNLTVISRDTDNAGSLEYLSKYYYHDPAPFAYVKRLSNTGDKKIVETYKVTYHVRRGTGVATGRSEYDALNPIENWGSTFVDLGRNWYFYKAVISVKLNTADETTNYDSGSDITL